MKHLLSVSHPYATTFKMTQTYTETVYLDCKHKEKIGYRIDVVVAKKKKATHLQSLKKQVSIGIRVDSNLFAHIEPCLFNALAKLFIFVLIIGRVALMPTIPRRFTTGRRAWSSRKPAVDHFRWQMRAPLLDRCHYYLIIAIAERAVILRHEFAWTAQIIRYHIRIRNLKDIYVHVLWAVQRRRQNIDEIIGGCSACITVCSVWLRRLLVGVLFYNAEDWIIRRGAGGDSRTCARNINRLMKVITLGAWCTMAAVLFMSAAGATGVRVC